MSVKHKNKHIDLDNARVDEQKQVMAQIIDADHCPFCTENLNKYHKQPILKESAHWLLTKNQWPYKHTKIHLLAIYKKHATHLHELEPEAGKELFELFQWAENEYSIPGGGFAMRFGETDYSAGTVAHIHAQFLMPDLTDPEYEPCRIKIGKSFSKL